MKSGKSGLNNYTGCNIEGRWLQSTRIFILETGEQMEYQYPIDHTWSTDEIIDVVRFFECIEEAYEKGINREELLSAYRRFKEIVPGKADEKNFLNEFEEVSGYSSYKTVKAAREAEENQRVKMK